jgi:hypothetical protein
VETIESGVEMANKKITDLVAAATANLTDLLEVANGNPDSQKLLISQIKALFQPYKIYRSLLNQSGAGNPPVPTILENTLGNIVWTYNDLGDYVGTLANAFPINKTFILIGHLSITDPISDVRCGLASTSIISLISYDDISIPSPMDNKLVNTPLEIIVYN